MSKTRYLCTTAIGIALYCVIDLGYIVFAIYAYYMGSICASTVGGVSAAIMSVLSGWFSAEWILANAAVGLICGRFYKRDTCRSTYIYNMVVTVLAVAIGMLVIKTTVSCWLFSIPILVKLPKSITAWIIDSLVMCVGVSIAPNFDRIFNR